ncbi:hypothetical protein ACXJY6_03545 [Vibrio sp. RC27]
MFKFRKEIGWSEIIALGALILSGLAYITSLNANKPFIVHGSGLINYAAINNDQCSYALSVPITFHNSGKQSVTLKQLLPDGDFPLVSFVNFSEKDLDMNLPYKVYMSNTSIGPVPLMWLEQIKTLPEFKASYKHIGELIRPSDSLSFYLNIVIEPNKNLTKYKNISAFLTLKASFSNDQIIPLNAAVELAGIGENCS